MCKAPFVIWYGATVLACADLLVKNDTRIPKGAMANQNSVNNYIKLKIRNKSMAGYA
jgi:hypothetical protein